MVQEKRLQQLQVEHDALTERKDSSEGELLQLQAGVDADEAALKGRLEEEQQLNQHYDRCRSEVMELFSQSNRLTNRREDIGRRLESEAERRQQLQQSSKAIQSQQEELKGKREVLLCELERLRAHLEEQKAQLEEWSLLHQAKSSALKQQQNLQANVRQKLEKARSMKESLEELQSRGEGYGEGTRLLLADQQQRQIAADLLRVDERYETVVEIALGERLQAVLATELNDYTAALARLDGHQARATFLIPSAEIPEYSFASGRPLFDLVLPLEGKEQIVKQLLGGVFLVEDISLYQRQSLPVGVSLVDPHGYRLDWHGLLSGGDTRGEGLRLVEASASIG